MLKNLSIFLAGAAISSLITWKLLEKYYDELLQIELDNIRYKNKTIEYKNTPRYNDMEELPAAPTEEQEYDKIIKDNDYNTEIEPTDKIIVNPNLKIIDAYDYGYDLKNDIEYTTVSLICYQDKTVAYDNNDLFTNALNFFQGLVDFDSLVDIDDEENEVAYVRDLKNKIDYEIIMSEWTYSEMLKNDERRKQNSED